MERQSTENYVLENLKNCKETILCSHYITKWGD